MADRLLGDERYHDLFVSHCDDESHRCDRLANLYIGMQLRFQFSRKKVRHVRRERREKREERREKREERREPTTRNDEERKRDILWSSSSQKSLCCSMEPSYNQCKASSSSIVLKLDFPPLELMNLLSVSRLVTQIQMNLNILAFISRYKTPKK